MPRNTELNLSRDKIKSLIDDTKLAEPYTENDEEYNGLDVNIDCLRGFATSAKILLDRYFKQHPEDSIENYID